MAKRPTTTADGAPQVDRDGSRINLNRMREKFDNARRDAGVVRDVVGRPTNFAQHVLMQLDVQRRARWIISMVQSRVF